MSKPVFYDYYYQRPPKVNTVLTDDTCFVSQSEVKSSSLSYMLDRFGMNTLSARLEEMRGKFGYADCTVNNDFATLQNQYVQAKAYFENLPSDIRRKYHDTPEEFYEDLTKNPETAYKTGFISEEKYKELTKDYVTDNRVDLVDTETSSAQSEGQSHPQQSAPGSLD